MMKQLLLSVFLFSALSAQANEFLKEEVQNHFFKNSEVTVATTSTFTFYDHGEPTVRYYESLDKITFGKADSVNLHESLKSFYKTKRTGDSLKATLDTNFFGFVDDIIVISCVNNESCSLSYNQVLKKNHLINGFSNPKYHAGLNGTLVNNFNTNSVQEAKEALISLKERGYADNVMRFSEYSVENSYQLALRSGPLAKLLNESNLCDDFVVHRCGAYCGRNGGTRSSNPDTMNTGTCIINLKN